MANRFTQKAAAENIFHLINGEASNPTGAKRAIDGMILALQAKPETCIKVLRKARRLAARASARRPPEYSGV